MPFDDADPPTYEAQASYLKRLKLLLPGEARRLKAGDFAPEIIHVVRDDDDDETERLIVAPNAVGTGGAGAPCSLHGRRLLPSISEVIT